jgi:hypothetical protein
VPLRFSLSINPDLQPLLSRFAMADSVAWTSLRSALQSSSETLMAQLIAASPRGRGASDHRRLAESWYLVDEGLRFRIRNTAPHLQYVLKGNNYPNQGGGSGWIYPRNGRFLRFTIDGRILFRRRVRAYAGRDFVTPVMRSWRTEAQGIFSTTMRNYVRWMARG